ncbi:MAG TPA: cytochrome ubiquinol oxidase subunit I, partial [candidate division Zixibacteria bacterium]|nr:cytochrome ubiquinol oxidase subunit I [candidate division Zixibacteria bacterium]
ITHVFMGAWQAGAFLVLSVSAWYLLRRRHRAAAVGSIKIAVVIAAVASLAQLVSGHSSANVVARHQPAKLAAFEGHYPESAPGDSYLFGWVDEAGEIVYGPKIPGLLSFLAYSDFDAPVTGLRAFAPEDRPPVNLTFQSFHLMVAIGLALIAISLAAAWYWRRGTLWEKRWFLWILVLAVVLPELANQLGWFSAEVGRQPWIVYGLLRTSAAASVGIGGAHVWGSLVMFAVIYILLGALFIYLLNDKIQHGPDGAEPPAPSGSEPVIAKEGPRA